MKNTIGKSKTVRVRVSAMATVYLRAHATEEPDGYTYEVESIDDIEVDDPNPTGELDTIIEGWIDEVYEAGDTWGGHRPFDDEGGAGDE